MKTYYQKNRAKLLAYQAAWRKAHPDRILVHRRTYYLSHGDALRAKARAYYWENREARLAYADAHKTNAALTGGAAVPSNGVVGESL